MNPADQVPQNTQVSNSNVQVQIPPTEPEIESIPEKPKGFFKNVGGMAKKVIAPLGVEVGEASSAGQENKLDPAQSSSNQVTAEGSNSLERPPLVVVNSYAQPAVSVSAPFPEPPHSAETPESDIEINILNSTVFNENPGEYLKMGEDGKLHLDLEKLKKDANRYLADPENLKKIIEANPHLKEELAGSGIGLPKT